MVRSVNIRRLALHVTALVLTGAIALVMIYFVAQRPVAGQSADGSEPNPAAATVTVDLPTPVDGNGDNTVANLATTKNFLPLIGFNHNPRLSMRIGYGATVNPITRYPAIRSLNAGWYLNWGVAVNPVRPAGMEYAQMIRVHQNIVETNGCGKYVTADRDLCPYVEPYSYSYSPDAATIQAAAAANPGSIWLIGNEPDRLDWNGFGQDEMLPELYAVAYKELYDLVKAADPQAQVAIAGIIQATPMRLEYLTKVWNEYKRLYRKDMPVDIWNVHNFVLEEVCERVTKDDGSKEFICYGSGVVPGSTVRKGSYEGMSWAHIDKEIFAQQIVDFRKWMKERGQANKPLIVTEYGVLYSEVPCSTPCTDPNWVNLQDPAVVQEFMLWSFDYFLTARDCRISDIDNCRLVQRWVWFSLDHEDKDPITGLPISNRVGNLFERTSRTMLPAGQRFQEYTSANHEALSAGY